MTYKTEKELFNLVRDHEFLKRLRIQFDGLLNHPSWWLVSRPALQSKHAVREVISVSEQIWRDPRLKSVWSDSSVLRVVCKRSREAKPYFFSSSNDQTHFCVPFVFSDRVVGWVGLSFYGVRPKQEFLNLFVSHVSMVIDNIAKSLELERLSATLRPRAVALSTVHTVHRIINSTLNLNELISRIAHLTAQVLRCERCAIYMFEESNKKKPQSKPELSCRALVGYPKKPLNFGRYKVKDYASVKKSAHLAQILLRKNFISAPLIDEDVVGVLIASSKKDRTAFSHFDQEILTTLAEEAVIAIKNARTYEEQRKVTLATIQSLAEIMGTRTNSPPPQEFLKLGMRIAEELKLNDEQMQALHYATLLKDTARVGIPDHILHKETKLTGEEFQLLRQHPVKGAKIVQSFENLKPVVPIILHLREKYDGTGYPKGLKGDEIPLGARILSVISAFEAIVMGRPYRSRASWNEAIDEIIRNSGSQFDPTVVNVFVKRVRREDFHKFLP